MKRSGSIGVLAFIALVSPVSSPQAKTVCELVVTADPAEMTAGQRLGRVSVTASGATPRLQASAGELKNLHRETGSVFVADYFRPARTAVPVVWVVATAEGGACGYLPIRLRSTEYVRPEKMNQSAAVLAVPGSLGADQAQEVTVYTFALDNTGSPRSGPPPALTVTSGKVSEVESIGPGAWRARWQVPVRGSRPDQVNARFTSTLVASTRLQRLTGPVAEIQVEFDRKQAVVGDPKPVAVTVRAFDAAGNPTDAEINVDVDGGQMSPLTRAAEGVYRATLSVPSTLGEGTSIFVLARAKYVSGNATLFLTANAPSRIELDAPAGVQADGSSSYYVTVKVFDTYGNPADEVPEAQSAGGDLGQPRQFGPGVWTFDYRPRRVVLETTDVISIRAGSSSASLSIQLIPPTFNFTVGAKFGVALVSGSAKLAPGAEIALWKQLGSQQFGLLLDGDWWSLSSNSSVEFPPPTGTVDFVGDQSYLPITLSAGWRVGLSQRLMLTVAAGGGVVHVSSSADLKQISQQISESGWVTTFNVAASLGFRVWRGYSFIQVRWLPMGDPGLKTLSGSISPILLQAGYRFDAG